MEEKLMKSLGESVQRIAETQMYIESPIEQQMLIGFMRDKRFTLVKGGEATGQGYFIYPQMQVDSYRADFIVKASGYKGGQRIWPPNSHAVIAVECDGREFHTSPEDVEYDRIRDAYFLSKGIDTMRFSGSIITRDINYCIDCIAHSLEQAVFNG